MIFLIGPRHARGAFDPRAPRAWCGPMKVLFRERGIAGFVDSWPQTLVPSASNRSTLEWTLVDSCNGAPAPSHDAGGAQLGHLLRCHAENRRADALGVLAVLGAGA